MPERTWTVGSAQDCDVRVERPTVSGRHCRLTQRGEWLLLEDLGSANGTYVAGERIASPRLVRRGDPVTLGHDTPLPWPLEVASITIGRLPDNDVVIPLDMISGRHARLEREGAAVFLVDLGSSNGTAINDPRNKISRARIEATDAVYLGSYRVPAAELLKMLPPARHATTLEAPRSCELERELSSSLAGAIDGAAAHAAASPFRSPASWLWGAGLSTVCALVIYFAANSGGRHRAELGDAAPGAQAERVSEADDSAGQGGESKADPPAAQPQPPSGKRPDPRLEPVNEARVRASERGVVVLGIRFGDQLVIVDSQAWAFAPDRVLCSSALIDDLKQQSHSTQGGDISIVICTPTQTIAIIDHRRGEGSSEGFTTLLLETPLEDFCAMRTDASPPIPKQPLALLIAQQQGNDSTSITYDLTPVTIARVERDGPGGGGHPAVLHCNADESIKGVVGAAAFDAEGKVIGCVRQTLPLVEVVPLTRLQSLINAQFP